MVSVAADEPDTAAKTVQPTILVCTSPPGSRASQGDSPRNMSSESRVRNRISPIQTNIGNAVSVQLEDDAQISETMFAPVCRFFVVRNSDAIQALPTSDSPTQRPDPSSRNSARINKSVMVTMLIPRGFQWSRAGSGALRAR